MTRPADTVSDEDRFMSWVRPCWPAMRRVAERLAGRADRDDVLQDALTNAWRHRGTFDSERGSAEAWLVTITVNAGRRHLRRRRSVELVEDVAQPAHEPDVDLHRAVGQLAGRQRLAVELFYFAGLPVRDVAAAMDCAEGTVKSTLSAARGQLKLLLGEDQS